MKRRTWRKRPTDARRDASSATFHFIDLHPGTLRRGCVTAGCSGDPDYDREEMLSTAEKVKKCKLQNSDANQILLGLFLQIVWPLK
jgi:hypothetical protein